MLITVIIPCFNVEHLLPEAINSVLYQNYKDLEIIIVDNGSTDKTNSVAQQFASLDPGRITVLQEKRQGPSFARNRGLAFAKGRWIQFLDADDILLPDKIQHQVSLIDLNPETSVIIASYYYHFINGSRKKYNTIPDPYKAILVSSFGHTCSNLWKKSEIMRVSGWDTDLNYGEEYQLLFELAKNDEAIFTYDDEAHTVVRQRKDSLSSRDWKILSEKKFSLQLKWIDWLRINRQNWYDDNYHFVAQTIYSSILSIGTKQPHKATSLYQKHFPNRYVPKISSVHRLARYQVLIIRIIGTPNYIRLVKRLKDILKDTFRLISKLRHSVSRVLC